MTTNITNTEATIPTNDYNFLNDSITQEILAVRYWKWEKDDGSIFLTWTTPNGVQFTMDADQYSFLSDFESQTDDFDVDMYVETWIDHRGEGDCPCTVKELLETAEYIKKELEEVVCDINITVATKELKLKEFGLIGNLRLMYSEKENSYSVWRQGKNLGEYQTINDMLHGIIKYHSWLI